MSVGELYLTFWSSNPDNELDLEMIVVGIVLMLVGTYVSRKFQNRYLRDEPIKQTNQEE